MMKRLTFLLFFLSAGTAFSQGIDLAPMATLSTNGSGQAGGAIGRTFNSFNNLTAGQYIQADLGASLPVSEISFSTWFSSDTRFIPAGYTIDYSNDNSTWTNLATVTGNTNVHPTHSTFVYARYWKLTVTALQSGQTVSNISAFRLVSLGVGALLANEFWSSPWNTGSIFTKGRVSVGTSGDYDRFTVLMDGGTNGTGVSIQAANGSGAGSQPGVAYLNTSGSKRMYHYLDVYSDSYHVANASGTNLVSILQNGNMGVGTSTPAEKFSVNGKIRSKEVKVEITGWPDYVFSPDHRLLSLGELANYVRINRHLPDVPPAEDVEKNGIELGDMNAKLLKKIEELTLYLIEKDKQITALEERLSKVEAQKP